MGEKEVKVQKEQKDFDILNKMKNLPGGLVIIPLVIAVIIATFAPQAFQIGGYVTALFYEGNSCMMGFFLIVCGSMINIKQVGMPLYKGVVMTGSKFLLGVILGLLVGKICGPDGFLGITPFVMIAAITNSNGSLYISLSSQFGNATDTGAISILSLNDGPFFTLVALGATGLASIPFKSLIATIIPLLIGFIWGNLDKGFRDACKSAQPIVTFFMTISIGAKTDISTIVKAGASGIVLGLISAATAVIFFFIINILLPKKERNAMGAAVGTTALNSAMTPAAVAEADPSMAQYTSMATAQCATASIITLFLCPFITAAFDKYMQKKQKGIYSPEGWAHDKVAAKAE
ncbi:2-keto-3-deoxygluconate permease [Bariatricus massiliensis]|uniref:2-keto-3-deoxygluconate permease n=1 Tax=Bariatricus massiliensis TaxID=1745713 RepID=A0ABS8DK66_9FIRM|nr:2-keto-3-deoxygluconate permease [Bariatricus massiliensis]MCB7305551.1 2-keto-3-deoxygluconate permease [Bariatricus massiliensis]MCB7376105.1 2-keto-3-deoxygluconate permease [Bariatricus massiliensis]MCB7388781.1 2-keto-3-deoxygluconate permease [Bariatricus massiliensis]MCB7412954.1 2-keto-3-deoxygluconate permease [Bariatricus massiliensis]MCQ5253260.1 2-keto-3-deoxygluconate permease [Bariatricus massiliensis]